MLGTGETRVDVQNVDCGMRWQWQWQQRQTRTYRHPRPHSYYHCYCYLSVRPMLLSVHVPDNDGQISCRAWGLRRDQGTATGADWWACGRRRHPPRSLRCLCLCLPIREPIRCHRRASLQHRRHPEPSLAPSRGATGDPRALSDWPQAGAIARTRQPRALFLPQPAIQSLARQAAMSRSSRFLFSSSSDEY